MNERPIARPTTLPGQPRKNNTGSEAVSDGRQGPHRSRQQHGNVSDTEQTERQSGRPAHRKPCRRYETRRAGCLNGGRCFVVELHKGLRRPGCRYDLDDEIQHGLIIVIIIIIIYFSR